MTNKKMTANHLFDRREFMKVSALTVMAASTTRAVLFANQSQAESLSTILKTTEADLYYRNRLADYQTPFQNDQDNNPVSLFDWDFPSLVIGATNGEVTIQVRNMASSQ